MLPAASQPAMRQSTWPFNPCEIAPPVLVNPA
jgi:hypothetical protein